MTDHDAYVTGSVTCGMCVCGEPWCESDDGTERWYDYDADGNLTKWKDENGILHTK